MGGSRARIWFDNLATAVAEHDGNLVRFNPRFLAFAREYGFIPRACHVRAAWEKGKVERAIGYARQNFWPLRSFTDLADVNTQAHHWLEEIANQRKHRETGQTPDERFQPDSCALATARTRLSRQHRRSRSQRSTAIVRRQSLLRAAPLCRLATHRQSRLPRVTIYDQHTRSSPMRVAGSAAGTFGAERFQKELFAQLAAAQRSAAQQRFIGLLGPTSEIICEAWRIPIARSRVRCANFST